MLKDLDKVEWSKIAQAPGSTSDIPALLRELTNTEQEVREAAYGSLYNATLYQGAIYEVTAYIVPFLIELLKQPPFEGMNRVLHMLEDITFFNIVGMTAYKGNPNIPTDLTTFKESFQTEQNRPNTPWQPYLAVYQGLPVYHTLLDPSQPEISEAAANLLAMLQEE